ncbi:MAG: bifunctional methylenetetrahydrofolate dehydrogenase/methenyltetrahydrofolate cyclohydrolase [Clostridiales Family XIII bacterium]|nr:bifunctional methylenetetrahydrofolate dehydrogenase/methenyltetrahydrofolate cyclohydrolase [Clostridiales Family XIII bacterium]
MSLEDKILYGEPVAIKTKESIKNKIDKLKKKGEALPSLVVIRIGNSAESIAYEKTIKKIAKNFDVKLEIKVFNTQTSERKIIEEIKKINKDATINGILLLKPLPEQYNEKTISNTINIKKDIDGVTDLAIAKLFSKKPISYCTPATAEAVILLLDYYKINIASKKVVILGRSDVIGKPLLLLLLNRDATITVCHTKTKNLSRLTKDADILISAIGSPNFIKKDFLSESQILVDVGTSVVDRKLVGDIYFKDAIKKVEKITPVPGGVGNVTNFILMKHLFDTVK